ncbi:hypothetical protein DFS34DRAFT_638993 [Phlyctochytrium arcticum]|nr:hypothetical protein DFS34DRAFT_638993 [Phlyctochytrium arcticum]
MVNQMNKVRKNLTRDLRAKKSSFKTCLKRTSKDRIHKTTQNLLHNVEALNAEMDQQVEDVCNGSGDDEEVARAVEKIERKEIIVRPGKMGKNSSVVRPILLSKKKVKLVQRREKFVSVVTLFCFVYVEFDINFAFLQARQREQAESGAGGMEVDMQGEHLLSFLACGLFAKDSLVEFRFCCADATPSEPSRPVKMAAEVRTAGTTLGGPPPS